MEDTLRAFEVHALDDLLEPFSRHGTKLPVSRAGDARLRELL